MKLKPIGQERVACELSKALTCVEKIKLLKTKTPTNTNSKRIASSQKKLKNSKTKLVFLSLRARDKVTRFYASNALKEIASKFL